MDALTLQQDALKLKQYEKLGPFEIKDFLAKVGSKTAQENSITYLNAGRGNPNWVATEPREAYFLLGQFAATESKRVLDLPPGVGGMPKAAGIAGRLDAWLVEHAAMPGQRVTRLADVDTVTPYFSILLIHGQGRRA